LALVVALFLPWYADGVAQASAWESMTIDDILLAIAGLGAIAAVLFTASRPGTAVPIAFTVLAALGGVLALVLVLWRMVDPAPPGDVGLAIGAWLGLAAALAIAGGALRGLHDEGPARRSPDVERAAAAAGRERAELLPLSAERGQES
jgi:hypothetical protein